MGDESSPTTKVFTAVILASTPAHEMVSIIEAIRQQYPTANFLPALMYLAGRMGYEQIGKQPVG